MNIAVIGAGFTGLAAAYNLAKSGHTVMVFEKETIPGGLAIGFRQDEWDWPLEQHYHHWFTNDTNILNLAKEIGHAVLTKRPKTSLYVDGSIYQLDSAGKLLLFPRLTVADRLRMAAALGFLRYNPFWQPLERLSTVDFLQRAMGKQAYEKIWKPQLVSKFGDYANSISLAWFWARIRKRTSHLAYPQGGFLAFANTLVGAMVPRGVAILLATEVMGIKSKNRLLSLTYRTNQGSERRVSFDKVIVTLPSLILLKLVPQLPESYRKHLSKLQGLGVVNLVLRLRKQLLADGTYWLSVCDEDVFTMAVVEHTNFIDKRHYNNEHIVYLGNYLPYQHPAFRMKKNELLRLHHPFLTRLHPAYRRNLIGYHLFTAPFAQPIITCNYSTLIPSFETPIPHLYLANIQQVYPWDRGTNYAVALGEKVAKLVLNS